MKKVLHYKTRFLNKSETFINRLVQNHQRYHPIALCYKRKRYAEGISVFEAPKKGVEAALNFIAFHANLSLPYYRKILKGQRPDLIHAHFGYDAVKLLKLSNKLDIPLVVSFYGADVSRLPTEFGWKQRYKKLAKEGYHFIAASEFMRLQLQELGFPEEKISVVRFGIRLENSKYVENSFNKPRLMMVGRMVEKKGFQYAIRGVSELKNRGYSPEFNIYGDGPLMDSLVRLVSELRLEDSVHFHGYQPVEKILDAHHNHTILLAPSVTAGDGDMEGLPNTILEAMAKGTVVIASRHAAIPEVVREGETGFLVEERNSRQLADRMEEIFSNGLNLDSIRRNARELIVQKYTVEQMVRNVEKIYDKILD